MTYYKPFNNTRRLLTTSCVGRLQISDNRLKLSRFVTLDSLVCFCFLKLIIIKCYNMASCLCFSRRLPTRLCVLVCMHECVLWTRGSRPMTKHNMLIFGVSLLFQATKQHLNNSYTVKRMRSRRLICFWVSCFAMLFRCPFQRGHFKLMTIINIGRRELLSCVPRLGLFLTVKSILLRQIMSPPVEDMFSASYANGTGRTER